MSGPSKPSLAEELGELLPADARACRVYGAMMEHPGEADTIWDACTNPSRAAPAVSRVLARHGITISVSTVKRHRRGECRCPQLLPDRYE